MTWRTGLIALVAAADVALFGGLVLREERARASGVEVRLPVEGYDPRDLLSGHYVRFRLIAEREAGALDLPAGPVAVCLEMREGRAHVARAREAADGCDPFLAGERAADGATRFGIERFYVDERRAAEVATLDAGPDTFVVGRIDGAGRLHLTDLVVSGRSFAGRN